MNIIPANRGKVIGDLRFKTNEVNHIEESVWVDCRACAVEVSPTIWSQSSSSILSGSVFPHQVFVDSDALFLLVIEKHGISNIYIYP